MRLTAALLAAFAATVVPACCGVSSELVPVVFTGQTDIVIWDSVEGIEHFVRNARFDAKGDVGFLAPTPGIPKLVSVPADAFKHLTKLLIPPSYAPAAGSGGFGGSEPPRGAPVVVVEMVDVGSYTAAILQAGDAAALKGWLAANGFPAPDDWLEGWVAPYLQNGWTITAFKLKEGETRATGPVRMSFRTDRPFAPYAVPEENGGKGSKLRLFLVSDVPLRGALGDRPWSAREVGRVRLTPGMTSDLAKDLKLKFADLPPTPVVIAYDDPAFGLEPRHDLFFSPAPRREDDLALLAFAAVPALGLTRRRA